MAFIVNCLLACSLVLTSAMGVSSYDPVPIFGVEVQCQTRGAYAGACISQNLFGGELTCLRLACALPMANGNYRAVYTGPVDDGTACASNKVCETGVCVRKHPSLITSAQSNVLQFDCISPPVPSISPYPPSNSRLPRVHPSSSSSSASCSRAGRGSRNPQRNN